MSISRSGIFRKKRTENEQEHKVSYRCSLPSPLQKGSKEVLIRLIHKCEIRWTLTNSLLEPLTLILMKILKSLWRIRFQTQLTTKLHLHQFSIDLSWPKVMSRTSLPAPVKRRGRKKDSLELKVIKAQIKNDEKQKAAQRIKELKKRWGEETESDATWRLSCIVKIMQWFWKCVSM